MFGHSYEKVRLFQWAVRPTRREVMDEVEDNYGMKWQHLYKQYGYRIEKVVVLRADEFEELLRRAGE